MGLGLDKSKVKKKTESEKKKREKNAIKALNIMIITGILALVVVAI